MAQTMNPHIYKQSPLWRKVTTNQGHTLKTDLEDDTVIECTERSCMKASM